MRRTPSRWLRVPVALRCIYYPQSRQSAFSQTDDLNQAQWRKVATKTTQMAGLFTGFIYSFKTIPHKTNRNPVGLNVLWGDGHVSFSSDPRAFDPSLWDIRRFDHGDLNPETTQIGFDQLWGGSGPETWGLSRANAQKPQDDKSTTLTCVRSSSL